MNKSEVEHTRETVMIGQLSQIEALLRVLVAIEACRAGLSESAFQGVFNTAGNAASKTVKEMVVLVQDKLKEKKGKK